MDTQTRLHDYAARITTRDYLEPDPAKWAGIAAAWRDAAPDERADFLRAIPHVVGGAVTRGAVDAEARTVDLSFSSEQPYERWWGVEILDHTPGAVNLARLNDGGALLLEHSRFDHVGTVQPGSAKLDRARGLATVRLGRSPQADAAFQDVQDGIKSLVSVGYSIDEMVLESRDNKTGIDTYRVTKWTPFEISLVAIPADPTVGVGRAAFASPAGPAPHVPAARTPMETTMPTETDVQAPADQQQRSAPTVPAEPRQPVQGDPLAAERERMREIRALGKRFGLEADADSAIDGGTTVEAFKDLVIARQQRAGVFKPAESPAIGMGQKDIEQYSFCRALLAAQDPVNAHKLAPFELEASRAAQDKRGDSRSKDREHAVTIPVDMLNSGLRVPEFAAARAVRELMARHQASAAFRDLVVGTATAGGNLVATELLGSSFIELLRAAMVLPRLGVRFLRDLNGNIAIPRQSGAASTFWVAENGAPTESQQTVDQVTLSPKTVGAFTDYSRRLLLQSSIDIETFVRADLAAVLGLAIEIAAINGSGASNQPTGLLNISGIGAVAGGTNGLAPAYDHMVDLESAVANANAAAGALAYLTNTKVRGKLRKTQEFASTNGKPVWASMPGSRGMEGDVLGYPAVVTNNVPSDLTKGTASGICSAIAFGNWAEMLIGFWGGLDMMLDPYTGATAGTKRVVALQDCDINVRHPASFAAMKDALTT